MFRLFNEHKKRKTQSRDGAWNFLTDPQGVGDEKGYKSGLPHGETVIVDGKEFVDMQFGTWAEMTYTEDGDTVQVEVTYHDEIRGSMTLTRTAADQYTVSGISGTVIDEAITGAIRVGSVFTWKE
jgi:hypothetical protein